MENISAVLWDLDGVLADTGELHFRSWMDTAPDYGIPFDREIFDRTFGMNNAGIVIELLGCDPGPERIDEISRRKEAYFCDAARETAELLPGVVDLLEAFQAAGLRQAVASSAPQGNIDLLIEKLGIGRYFAALVSGYDLPGRPSKPDPAVFLEAARRLNNPTAACLVVEDAHVGIEAARRGGMACLAVANTHPADSLTGADLVLEQLDSLPPAEILAFFGIVSSPGR